MAESPFSTTNPQLQLAVDATSLSAFMRCPRYYQYTILRGWRKRREAITLTFGGLLHACLEAYDKARIAADPHALRTAVRYALEHTKDFESDDNTRTRFTLIRTLVWYADQYTPEPLQIITLRNGKAAVELSFRFGLPIESAAGEQFTLCGHMDGLVAFGSSLFVLERKHTTSSLSSSYFDRYAPNTQISVYSLAGKVVFDQPVSGVIVDAAQVAVNFSRFMRAPVNRTPAQIAEFQETLTYHIRKMEDCAVRGTWPMNEEACYLYGGCTFRGICSKDPAVRENFLAAEFTTRHWNPLEIRGD